MRQIGHIDNDKDARTFGDFLYVQGIATDIDRDEERWAVWVHNDDDIPKAKELLDEFRAGPNASRWQAGSPAEKLRQQAQAAEVAYRKRFITGKKLFPGMTDHGFGFVTYALIVACIVVFLVSNVGRNLEKVAVLFFSWQGDLQEIRRGEVWRVITPIFIHMPVPLHFPIMHILFNMLWLRDLGSLIEARTSSLYLFVFVILTAAGSNCAEVFIGHHAHFGGMSGVVYALIGYAWIRGRFDPGAGIALDRQNVIYALIWFVLCFTGMIGPVANWAHAGGLVTGMVWAFIDSKRKTA